MRKVIVESPYKAKTFLGRWLNVRYARKCVRHSLLLGEAPYASHLFYTQPGILNDSDARERLWGIEAGLLWGMDAEATIVYIDRGVSQGMRYGIEAARKAGRPVETRSIKNRPETVWPVQAAWPRA